jgi:hypothetical protein
MIAGIDYSTRAVDVVLLDEDTDAATWHRFPLEGKDAFDRARNVHNALAAAEGFYITRASAFWDDVLAVGIEDPRGYGAGSLYRVQGAILSCIPAPVLVHPLIPSQWRKTVGLPGNAPKHIIHDYARNRMYNVDGVERVYPQDAMDAYCIALATRTLLERVPA